MQTEASVFAALSFVHIPQAIGTAPEASSGAPEEPATSPDVPATVPDETFRAKHAPVILSEQINLCRILPGGRAHEADDAPDVPVSLADMSALAFGGPNYPFPAPSTGYGPSANVIEW